MDSDRFFCRYSELPLGFDRHFHNAHQLLYIVSGEVRVQVGSSVYGGQPGDLFVISRLEEHGTALEKVPTAGIRSSSPGNGSTTRSRMPG